jgi:hypothetical protein
MIKLRRLRWAGHVERMGGRRRSMHIGFWWKSQKERDHMEDADVGGRLILNWILEEQNVVVWTGLIWFRIGASGGLL